MGYSPWGCKESDTTEQLNNNSALYKVLRVYRLTHSVRGPRTATQDPTCGPWKGLHAITPGDEWLPTCSGTCF